MTNPPRQVLGSKPKRSNYGYLKSNSDALKARMEKLWNYEKRAPSRSEFHTLLKTMVCKTSRCCTERCKNRKRPNTFSKTEPHTWRIGFSKDGSKVAYAISEGGIGEK
jgi:prolyl oligopeptidase